MKLAQQNRHLVDLLAAKDPLAFQAISGTPFINNETEVFDPSDEGEYNRYMERHSEGEGDIDDADEYDYRRELFPSN